MGRELSSSWFSLNRAQRYWLAVVIPALVAIPFWWKTYHLEYAYTTTIYLAVVASLATAWIVLSLIGIKPWRRIPRQTMAVLMPAAAFALTVFAVLIDHSWWVHKAFSLVIGFAIQLLSICCFWAWRRFGKSQPSEQMVTTTYWAAVGITFLLLLAENQMLEVFGPDNLPYWFATIVLLTPVMLWLLRSSEYEDVLFVMASRRAKADIGIPISPSSGRKNQNRVNQ